MYEYRKLSPEERANLVEERLARGYPPHQPPHLVEDQARYLLTAACYEHRHLIDTADRRKQLVDLLFEGMIGAGIEIYAWVVLPNHYHLLTNVEDSALLGRVFRLVHGRTSRLWNLRDKAIGRKVWYRYSDRLVRSERHYYTTLNYIHYNPVRHGYVGSPYDWEMSSLSWYLDSMGREWLRDVWVRYPVREYGSKWDRY